MEKVKIVKLGIQNRFLLDSIAHRQKKAVHKLHELKPKIVFLTQTSSIPYGLIFS
ncbi:MAG: hypothetical protein AABX95_03195 [Nanoarchaeota archaeon]